MKRPIPSIITAQNTRTNVLRWDGVTQTSYVVGELIAKKLNALLPLRSC